MRAESARTTRRLGHALLTQMTATHYNIVPAIYVRHQRAPGNLSYSSHGAQVYITQKAPHIAPLTWETLFTTIEASCAFLYEAELTLLWCSEVLKSLKRVLLLLHRDSSE